MSERVLYFTHWDTRPTADNETDPARRRQPIPGANDGASGVGLFLALADLFTKTAPSVGIDLLFVDGEDYGDFSDPNLRDVLIGSQHFAKNLPERGYAPLYGVVWDMIGDKDLRILEEGYSVQGAPEVVSLVWQTAENIGYGEIFQRRPGVPIVDDQVPLLKAGLRVIDVIDPDYKSATGHDLHHTLDDTLDKLSERSLQAVGDVAVSLVTNH